MLLFFGYKFCLVGCRNGMQHFAFGMGCCFLVDVLQVEVDGVRRSAHGISHFFVG
jgi:hypothetical protein